jgi:glycosyltransferase involved in cell wall biosynthesis
MNTSPKVGIIVPNFNYGRFLPRCLDSLIAQTYANIEVVVVDGGSTDNSLDVIKVYSQRIPTLRFFSEKDEGPADAINKGIRHTTSPLLTWLNSDDALNPFAIELAVAEFEKNNQLSLVYGSVLNVAESGAIVGLNRGLKLKKDDLTVFDFVPQTGAVFKRFENLELNKSLEWGFDWELWIELSRRGDILNINHIVGSCIVAGQDKRKSDMIIPRRTQELARIARKYTKGFDIRIVLAYLAAMLGYGFMPLGFLDVNYHRRIVRWISLLSRILCGKTEKGIML